MSKMCNLINICRCCLSNDCYKDISTEYFFSGLKEVYADMLLHTFNIDISYNNVSGPSSTSRLICDLCIQRLRDASEFRRQVLQVEETMAKHLSKISSGDICASIVPKSEETPLQDFLDENFDDFTVDSDSELPVKVDHSDVVVKHEDNSITHQSDVTPTAITASEEQLEKKDKRLKKKVSRNRSKTDRLSRRKNIGGPRKVSQSDINLRTNTETLVANSNMCLFKSLKTKYQCFYCPEAFLHVKQLREHSLTHPNKGEWVKGSQRNSRYKCAEITDLRCSLCDQSLPDIDELKTHLTHKHLVSFADAGYALIPYRISERFACLLCSNVYQTFLRLSIHMHSHYSNHVCEHCGTSFINKDSLRIHMAVHRERRCTICLTSFKSSKERLRHYRSAHRMMDRWKRYCLQCDETFKYTYLLEAHMISAHGAASKEVECQDCRKTFKSPYYFKVHVRSVHLRERNHQCVQCPMRFFTKTDRVRHERSHGVAEDQLVPCALCAVKFKSKDSWRRHVRRQHAK